MTRAFRLSFFLLAVASLLGCDRCDDDNDDTPPPPPPAAPSGLTATAITTERIDLAWTDNATDETDFRIEQSPDGLAGWTQIAVLPANSTTHTVRGLTPNTAYFFRVAAANSGALSGYAGPATATTPQRTWTGAITPATRPDLAEHSAIFDAANQRMVVFGGVNISGFTNEVWALSLATPGSESWGAGALATSGTPPSARWQHSAIYDIANQRMIVFGGDGMSGRSAEVWSLSLTAGTETWSPLSINPGPAPTARRDHTAIYDETNGRMIVFGGNTSGGAVNEVWSLSLPSPGPATWTQLFPTVPAPPMVPPSGRQGHSAVYDKANQRMILFAGNNGTFNANDAWTLSLTPPGSPEWALLSPGTPPSVRQGHAAIFDQANLRMTVYSGDDSTVPLTTTETYILNPAGGTSWQVLSTGGPTSGRSGHTAIFDSANNRLVIFGGWDDNFVPFDDVWTLRL